MRRAAHGKPAPPSDHRSVPQGAAPTEQTAADRAALPSNPAPPRSVHALPALIGQTVLMAWRAAPRLFAMTVLIQLGMALLATAQVFAAQYAFTAVLRLQHHGSFLHAVVAVGILAATMAATDSAAAGQSFQQRLLSQHVAFATSRQLLEVSSDVDLMTFETSAFFEDLQRVEENTVTQILPVTNGLVSLLGGLLTVVTVAAALFRIQPLLPPFLLLTGIPLLILSRRASKREFAFLSAQVMSMRLRYALQLLLTGRNEAKEIRAFGLAAALRGRWEQLYLRYLSDLHRHIRRRQLLHVSGSVAAGLITTGALGFVLWLVQDHRLALSGAGAALIGVRLLASRITQIFTGIAALFEASLFLSDFRRFMSRREPTGVDRAGELAAFEQLELHDVGFTYPGSDHPALVDITMKIRSGQVIALVGENGSGKTTLAKLVAGLYPPTRGSITWDGRDIATMGLGSVRPHVSVIFQDYVRFPFTARENVALGGGTLAAADEEVQAATVPVGADTFLRALPLGYDTVLSKEYAGGADLSVGQWQRVAMARALFRRAGLVVLDEPTAALDARAEAQLFTTIRESLAGTSVLLISHRFSSVRNADRIYVLHEGRLVEDGTHAELMASGGRYAELFRLQASAYLDEGPDAAPAPPAPPSASASTARARRGTHRTTPPGGVV